MRLNIARCASLAVVILAGAMLVPPAPAAGEDEILIFSFFRDNGQTGIYLAASDDGLTFTPLNGDQPVMAPAPWSGQNLTRDPSIVYHDGTFHAVWTSSWKGNCFGYAESKDLVTWTDPVKVEPFPAGTVPNNTWAPEICWDPVRRNFMIVWSSIVKPAGQQLFVTRTADGKTFTTAKHFLDRPFGCIDAMSVFDRRPEGNRWVTIYKNEEPEAKGGKNLLVATASEDFSQWTMNPVPIVGPGTGVRPETMAEGPSLLKREDRWYLYWDSPLKHTFSIASSTDLEHWTDHTAELTMPPQPRHGTIFQAPRSAVGWLRETAESIN